MNGGTATLYPGDFEYYAAKRGLDIESRGATEGHPTPRGLEESPARARESSAEATARKRAEAEERNRRYRRTRDLRDALGRTEHESAETDALLARLTDRLADSSVYADATTARDLIAEYNAARDRADHLASEWTRIGEELARVEAEEAVASPARR